MRSKDVAGMTGKTVVITGANSGIGFETAVALARAGATTVITARNLDKGTAALARIRDRSASDKVSLVVFDLASLASTAEGAARILDSCGRIDVLINNAGVALSERGQSADGFEATFAINHLGPFFLTQKLMDRLKASAPARVINVSSMAYRSVAGLDFDDLQTYGNYSVVTAYGRSKLANIYFTTELARRLSGTGVTVNCLHPGLVATGFARHGDVKGLLAIGMVLVRPFLLSARRGAHTSVYLASSPGVADITGQYFVRRTARPLTSVALDPAAAARLWQASQELVVEAGA
jgi:NAD(P)-dependent dehydrogenase (short-subunit alcohol dehydrogenase family)